MRSIFLCLMFSLISSVSWGQDVIPLTEPSSSQAPFLPPSSTSPNPFPKKQTQSLLQLQADKSRPGKAIPLLGATAHRSWERYLNSFTHPLPERFDERVSSQSP